MPSLNEVRVFTLEPHFQPPNLIDLTNFHRPLKLWTIRAINTLAAPLSAPKTLSTTLSAAPLSANPTLCHPALRPTTKFSTNILVLALTHPKADTMTAAASTNQTMRPIMATTWPATSTSQVKPRTASNTSFNLTEMRLAWSTTAMPS